MTSKYDVASDAAGALEFCRQFYRLENTKYQKGIVLKRDGEVIGACVYDEFNGVNCFMHCAGKPGTRFVTRDFLYWAYHYPFVQLGCNRVTAMVEASNTASRRFIEHVGWKYEASLKGAAPNGGDILVYVLWKDACRYIKERPRDMGRE